MRKGEFSDYELLVEQSDTIDGKTISLWITYDAFRKQNVKYEVDVHDPATIEKNHGYEKLGGPFACEPEARESYETYCSEHGYDPYP